MIPDWVEQIKQKFWSPAASDFLVFFVVLATPFVAPRPEFYLPFLFHYPARSELQEISGKMSYVLDNSNFGQKGTSKSPANYFRMNGQNFYCTSGSRWAIRWGWGNRHCPIYDLRELSSHPKFLVLENAKVLYHTEFGIFEISVNDKVSSFYNYDKTISEFKIGGYIATGVISLFFVPFCVTVLQNYRRYKKSEKNSKPEQPA